LPVPNTRLKRGTAETARDDRNLPSLSSIDLHDSRQCRRGEVDVAEHVELQAVEEGRACGKELRRRHEEFRRLGRAVLLDGNADEPGDERDRDVHGAVGHGDAVGPEARSGREIGWVRRTEEERVLDPQRHVAPSLSARDLLSRCRPDRPGPRLGVGTTTVEPLGLPYDQIASFECSPSTTG
jgi:hypothetical protein